VEGRSNRNMSPPVPDVPAIFPRGVTGPVVATERPQGLPLHIGWEQGHARSVIMETSPSSLSAPQRVVSRPFAR
jgi:hypothetical protein